jgi:hypothetical protein
MMILVCPMMLRLGALILILADVVIPGSGAYIFNSPRVPQFLRLIISRRLGPRARHFIAFSSSIELTVIKYVVAFEPDRGKWPR